MRGRSLLVAGAIASAAIAASAALVGSPPAGMVMRDGMRAFRTHHVAPALKWVRPADEEELTGVFRKAEQAGRHGEAASDVAERYFLETLARLNAADMDAPYQGLPGPVSDEPVLTGIDLSLDSGSIDFVAEQLAADTEIGIRRRFLDLQEKARHADESAAAGRAYAESYGSFVQYVERLYADLGGDGEMHETIPSD